MIPFIEEIKCRVNQKPENERLNALIYQVAPGISLLSTTSGTGKSRRFNYLAFAGDAYKLHGAGKEMASITGGTLYSISPKAVADGLTHGWHYVFTHPHREFYQAGEQISFSWPEVCEEEKKVPLLV